MHTAERAMNHKIIASACTEIAGVKPTSTWPVGMYGSIRADLSLPVVPNTHLQNWVKQRTNGKHCNSEQDDAQPPLQHGQRVHRSGKLGTWRCR